MIKNVDLIVNNYLKRFPNEKKRMDVFCDYLERNVRDGLVDWNNEFGHITVGAFVYCESEDKFLVLFHKDLKMYLYPGGHVDKKDSSLFDAAKRELKEETGLENLNSLKMDVPEVPFDIDTHSIPFNDRIHMPKHFHFDFRYLFFIDESCDIVLDEEECKDYKWITSNELSKDENYGNIVNKLREIIKKS